MPNGRGRTWDCVGKGLEEVITISDSGLHFALCCFIPIYHKNGTLEQCRL